jgi:hypothetical protein
VSIGVPFVVQFWQTRFGLRIPEKRAGDLYCDRLLLRLCLTDTRAAVVPPHDIPAGPWRPKFEQMHSLICSRDDLSAIVPRISVKITSNSFSGTTADALVRSRERVPTGALTVEYDVRCPVRCEGLQRKERQCCK